MSIIRQLDWKDIFVFILGLLLVGKIRIVGTFSYTELLLIPCIIFGFAKFKGIGKIMFLSILWLIGCIIANNINDINKIDSLKGEFFIIVFIFLIPPIYWLLHDDPRRIIFFFLGSGISGIFAPEFAQDRTISEFLSNENFRFYAWFGFITGISGLLYFCKRKYLSIIIMEVSSIIGLFYGSRNAFFSTTIAAACLLFFISFINKKHEHALFKKKFPYILIIILISLFAINYSYEFLAENMILGEEAYNKYVKQKSYGNILEGGRGETFMGIELIKNKPITGYGSYAKDTYGYREKYASEHNVIYNSNIRETRYLPSHSHLIGAWMQNGILGGIFWLYVLFILWKFIKSGSLFCEKDLLGLIMFKTVALIWDILFSPFGDRVSFLFLFLTLFVIYQRYKNNYYNNSLISNN